LDSRSEVDIGWHLYTTVSDGVGNDFEQVLTVRKRTGDRQYQSVHFGNHPDLSQQCSQNLAIGKEENWGLVWKTGYRFRKVNF
jgi:hypothetical protein